MTQESRRHIDVDVVPRFGTCAFKVIMGANQQMLSQHEFEQLLSKGEGALREGDLMQRKRMGSR